MVETADHAALRIGGSSGVLLVRAIAASSVVSPQIRDISTLTSAPKPVRILSMNSMAPTLKIQVSKKPFAETMTTPPEGDVLADRSLCLEHGSLSDFILHPSYE
jgi:hypothetical protein